MTVNMVQMGDHALWGFREEVSMLGHYSSSLATPRIIIPSIQDSLHLIDVVQIVLA
jgi:hypothetical protein